MPFDPNSAKKAGKKSKRGPAKKQGPSIKEKMELLYEKVLDDLLVNQDKLTKTLNTKQCREYIMASALFYNSIPVYCVCF